MVTSQHQKVQLSRDHPEVCNKKQNKFRSKQFDVTEHDSNPNAYSIKSVNGDQMGKVNRWQMQNLNIFQNNSGTLSQQNSTVTAEVPCYQKSQSQKHPIFNHMLLDLRWWASTSWEVVDDHPLGSNPNEEMSHNTSSVDTQSLTLTKSTRLAFTTAKEGAAYSWISHFLFAFSSYLCMLKVALWMGSFPTLRPLWPVAN